MESFITVYFTEDYEPSDAELEYFERAIGREIAQGDGFINVYTRDMARVKDLISLIGEFYISEIAA